MRKKYWTIIEPEGIQWKKYWDTEPEVLEYIENKRLEGIYGNKFLDRLQVVKCWVEIEEAV